MPRISLTLGALAELEDALAGAVAETRRDDPLGPVTVLVGHVLLKSYLRRALALRDVPLINVTFARPHELALALARGAVDARQRITPGVERMLVREVAAGAGGYFAGIASRDGFARALGRLFRELEIGGFDAPAFAAAASSAMPGSAKGAELARLYAEYRARCDRFAGLADAYAAAAATPFAGPLLVYGLWSPAEAQARLIDQIARTAPVTVFLPASGLPIDEAHEAFRRRLRAAGAEERVLPPRDGVALAPLAARLFRPPEAPVAAPVALVSAPDTVREVWEAARACLAWAREGIRFHEMAVVYRNRDPYRALVDEIFKEAKIDTYIHDGRMLSAHPLGRRVLALLALAAARDAFPRPQVMEFLTETRFSRDLRARYERVRPSEWEAHTRDAGIVEGIDQWRERLAHLAARKREEARDERFAWLDGVAGSIDVLARFIEDLHTALAARPDEGTWDDHLSFLREVARDYADGTAPVIEALDDLRQLAAVRDRVTFDEFCRAVRDDLESRDASLVLGEPVRLFGRQGVAVLDASSLRHMRFRAVFMLGVAERAWPPPPRPDPLLLEHERRAINGAGGGVLPLRTEPDEEALGFWVGAQAARQRLTLSYARADAGRTGKHLPSYFFRSVADAIEGKRLRLDALEAARCVERVRAGRLTCEPIEASLSPAEYDRGLIHGANETDAPAALEAIARATPAFRRAMAARAGRWSRDLTAYDGVMVAPDAVAAARARSAFTQGHAVSPSRLEMWATCPYRYFARHTLGIEPVQEPEAIERINALDRGSLIHEILEEFLRELGRDDPPSTARRAPHLQLLLEIADRCGEDRRARGLTGRPILWQIDRQKIFEDLANWYDREAREIDASGLKPGAFEARFGALAHGGGEAEPLSSDDPLEVDAGGRTVLVQGRIDRIDWDDARTRFRVIDYKTGQARAKGTFDGGEALQLPVYLLAAARMLEMNPAEGESQYFFMTRAGSYKRHVINGMEFVRARRADFDRIIATIAEGVDGGFFAPNASADHCKYCDYKDVCDARIVQITERKRAAPAGAAYRALAEIE